MSTPADRLRHAELARGGRGWDISALDVVAAADAWEQLAAIKAKLADLCQEIETARRDAASGLDDVAAALVALAAVIEEAPPLGVPDAGT